MSQSSLETTDFRRRAVALAVALAADTPIAPSRYELHLLERYQNGELTIDQVIALCDAAPYQLLYRSRATTPPTEADLQHLLDHARKWNAEAGITGLLLYSDGRYVQVLEGPKDEVRAVYARIRRDPRHTQVVTLSEGLGPSRRFPKWRMALGNVAQPAVARLLEAVLAEEPFHSVPINDPLLHQLLEAFGVNAEAMMCEAA
jgi:hypothetical protein